MAQERVQVVVRLRPLSEAELGDKEAWSSPEPTALTLSCGDAASTWQYDRVFPAPTSSDEVYKVTCKDLVSSTILGGLNSVVFAYGQTGSGKTHTISALMRLACQDTFRLIEADSGREFLLRLVRELLTPVLTDLVTAVSGGLRVMDDPESGTHVEGLREEGIESVTHLEQLLRNIEQNRQVRDTRMNNSSSRGHLIVRIIVESRDSTPHSSSGVVVSTLNFVDLAGSERLSQAAMEAGDSDRLRQKEASNINRSLLTLGTVIRALGDLPAARKHVPFRDSKLTRILQPALAGNARMAIVVTISPAGRAVDTTRAALHFANAAKRVVMSPKVNKVHDESKAVIRRMQAEIEALKMAVVSNLAWLLLVACDQAC
ncbi:P-loop containing nucleoside triphosphate hydrolase protein [Haematococcus lacustris]